jgi:hypothetical protein
MDTSDFYWTTTKRKMCIKYNSSRHPTKTSYTRHPRSFLSGHICVGLEVWNQTFWNPAQQILGPFEAQGQSRESRSIFSTNLFQSPCSLFTVFWTVTLLTVTRCSRPGPAGPKGNNNNQRPRKRERDSGKKGSIFKAIGPKQILLLLLPLRLTEMPLCELLLFQTNRIAKCLHRWQCAHVFTQ